MGKSETTTHSTAAVSALTAEPGSQIYWNHFKTLLLILATNSLYFCELLLLVGGGAFARSIAAVVGGESLTSWPPLVLVIITVALCPPVAQAADYWGRKWFLVIPAIFGCVGCIIVARAQTFEMAIAGFCVGGISFGSQSLFLTVASEVLPRKYRSWGQASANASVALGSIFALCVGGYLTRSDAAGFRTYFYICAGIHAFSAVACAFLYNSAPRELQVTLSLGQKLRSLDWVGYVLIAAGTVLFCLGLSWAQNPYPWTDAHVLAPFLIGGFLLIILFVYSWKFKKDGLLHHGLFHDRNFPIALISVFIEGMAFMAANVYFPYMLSVLQGTTMGPFRQALCYNVAFCTFAVTSLGTGFYIYKTRTVRVTGIATFIVFLIFFILMASITATTPQANFWGYILFYGLGLGFCLTTFVTAAQFSTPQELIAITSGLTISIRSLGGSIGLAIFNAIFAHGLTQNLFPKVAAAVTPLGLPEKLIGPLIGGLSAGNLTAVEAVPGVTPDIIAAAGFAIRQAYVIGFRDVFICGGSFSVVAIIAAAFLRNPSSEFNTKIDAPIEITTGNPDLEAKFANEQQIENKEMEE